jgi:hypothetical protein
MTVLGLYVSARILIVASVEIRFEMVKLTYVGTRDVIQAIPEYT